MADVRIGTSGWRYAEWRGDYYPRGLVQRRELAYVAARLGTVEVNASFYSLQRPTTYQRWREEVPEDYVVAVKGGRFITHLKRLRDVETPLANYFASGVLCLGPVLGPVLWQLPERLAFGRGLVDHFLGLLPRTTADAAALAEKHDDKVPPDRAHTTADADRPLRHVLEVRHPSFTGSEALDLLRGHDVACVVADTAGRFPMVLEMTSPDLAYVRLHGEERLYGGGYSDASLDRWAERCRSWHAEGRDVLVYFDNDIDGRAPWDAERLQERLR